MAFGHFLLGSHNLMVTALDSCVKWPLHEHLMSTGIFTSILTRAPEIVRKRLWLWFRFAIHLVLMVCLHIPGGVANWEKNVTI